MKLVILGNGFDLHHKYKTSFSDFRNHLKGSTDSDDQKLISDVDIVLNSKNTNLEKGIMWNDFERIIGEIMTNGSEIKVGGIELLSLTENFTQRFFDYLNEENTQKKIIENKIIKKEIGNASTILTFNYTKYYLPYLKEKGQEVFHIHGELAENNLPLIGYFYPNASENTNYTDFLRRFHDRAFHKPALAYKQNELSFSQKIIKFESKWASKISEIVIIGYSFGESDSHIYNILSRILVKQDQSENIPLSIAEKVPIIKFKFFNYNSEETIKLISKVKSSLFSKNKRRSTINITKGIKRKKKDIICFEMINYN